MATIKLTDVQFYKGGKSGASAVAGNDWANNAPVSRVVRYTFTAPSRGATKVSFTIDANQFGDGAYIDLRYYIGTSETSHANAGKNSEYTGEFAIDKNYVIFTAEADILLVPNETYYLWVFPASSSYGWYHWPRKDETLEATGSAGLVYIDNGSEFEAYQLYIDNGSGWDLYIPHIDNGSSWDMCS